MKRILLQVFATIFCIGYMNADITISVPKKWKGRTLYVKQVDINQVFNRQQDEPIHQITDTLKIKGLTFSVPAKLECATKVNILSPKKDESDFDHTIAEACVMPEEEVHLYLDDNSVRAEGSPLNQQMSAIYTKYMQTLTPFLKAYAREDKKEVARIATESQQWFANWVYQNPSAPGAGAAIYQISNPELVAELSKLLEGEALTSMYYPYASSHIERAQQILQRREATRRMNEECIEAPNFTLSDLSGNQVSLSDFKGKWIILDFWGSWCAPCLKSMPELKEVYEEYAGKLEIIGIDCNDTEEAWKDAVTRLDLPWVNLHQPDEGQVTSAYAVTAFPTKVVIDPTGKIMKVYSGASPTFKEDLASRMK